MGGGGMGHVSLSISVTVRFCFGFVSDFQYGFDFGFDFGYFSVFDPVTVYQFRFVSVRLGYGFGSVCFGFGSVPFWFRPDPVRSGPVRFRFFPFRFSNGLGFRFLTHFRFCFRFGPFRSAE